MTTEKQAAANRRNARQSTGPRTEQGKAIARLNALKHGTLATTPVVPRLERPDEWERHLAATLESLGPVGHLEAVLAQRVALLLWRLGRVARYEREVIGVAQERADDDLTERRRRSFGRAPGGESPREVREAAERARGRAEALAEFAALPEDEPLAGEDAAALLCAVAGHAEAVELETFSMPEVVPDEVAWEDHDGWTAGLVRRGVAAMAAAEGTTPERLWAALLDGAEAEREKLKAEVGRVAEELDRMRRERLLPDAAELDKLTRYEAHLGRQLDRALHELQRLQAARSGSAVPAPAVVDVNVNGGA